MEKRLENATFGGATALPTNAGVVYACGEACRFSTRVKYYGSTVAEIMLCNKAIFNANGVLTVGANKHKAPDWLEKHWGSNGDGDVEISTEESFKRSKRRARTMVFDLAMCNPGLDMFLTLTLDKTKIDRYDYNQVVSKLNRWLDNMVRRKGFKYVMVAEYHKDGAIHFHALANSAALTLTNSGKKDKQRHVIYNVDNWKFGFTTATRCYGERAAACKYMCKYITKGESKVGGRWYYSGGDLVRPRYEYLPESHISDFDYLGINWNTYIVEKPEINLELCVMTNTFDKNVSRETNDK